jgi:aminopeptidase-like protein
MTEDLGNRLYSWASDLFPVNRSLTGQGVRDTLKYLKNIVPELEIKSIPTGTKVFDWTIPKEWNVKDAYIIDPKGKKIADFKKNNLHLMGYSIPINKTVSLNELQNHLHSLNDQPEAIPYITSYYKEDWGFCISQKEKDNLTEGDYKIFIDSKLFNGVLNYGEVILPGKSNKEILLSTYICHPSMANNELSGPVVTTALVKWLSEFKNRKYTYRIVFIPETIGSIAYISSNYSTLINNVLGGFVITCVGDDNNYSLLESKFGNTIFDKIGNHVLKNHTDNDYQVYSFLKRGSDERQYSSVGVDIPIISLMRSKYFEYPEYHTSLDNLDFISPQGLLGGYTVHKKAIEILEQNEKFKINTICEPQLGKRGLYPLQSTKDTQSKVELMMNIIAYLDGNTEVLSIAEMIGSDFNSCMIIIDKLLENNLIEKVNVEK